MRRHCAHVVSALLLGFLALQTAPAAQEAADIRIERTSVRTDDGVTTEGTLCRNPADEPQTVVVTMHPNGDRHGPVMLRRAVERGYAGYGMKNRWIGSTASTRNCCLTSPRRSGT